jgi:hypothetical protein
VKSTSAGHRNKHLNRFFTTYSAYQLSSESWQAQAADTIYLHLHFRPTDAFFKSNTPVRLWKMVVRPLDYDAEMESSYVLKNHF